MGIKSGLKPSLKDRTYATGILYEVAVRTLFLIKRLYGNQIRAKALTTKIIIFCDACSLPALATIKIETFTSPINHSPIPERVLSRL
jgi:hypothetical protein